MNFKAILTITFISVAICVKAQDRIITLQNDTINCKISKVNSSNIFFTIITGNVLTKGKIERERVLSYYSGNTAVENDLGFSIPEPSRWRLGLSGGFNYLTASSSKAETALIQQGIKKSDAESYYKNLKPGIRDRKSVV